MLFEKVILIGTNKNLLRQELADAFTKQRIATSLISPEAFNQIIATNALEKLLQEAPTLLFSVNFQGLERLKTIIKALENKQSKLAIWCVDNPWNLLSSVKTPAWKLASIFVTDPSFIPSLQEHGARNVFHLPLAVDPTIFLKNALPTAEVFTRAEHMSIPLEYEFVHSLAPVVFVGRSTFPGKEHFFSGLSLPLPLLAEAEALLYSGSPQKHQRPDFKWWNKKLSHELTDSPRSSYGKASPSEPLLWPGKKGRLPSFGAETCTLSLRSAAINQAALASERLFVKQGQYSLDIFGDNGWRNFIPQSARLNPPVDYYGALPYIYAQAKYSLNIMSLQLPAGLNQRHFDVFTAGGVCLSNDSPGLALFPEELVKPIAFKTPQDIPAVLENFEKNVNRQTFIKEWRNLLLSQHTYKQRVEYILNILDIHAK